jgi:hypothetical protein
MRESTASNAIKPIAILAEVKSRSTYFTERLNMAADLS